MVKTMREIRFGDKANAYSATTQYHTMLQIP
mgnify:CR=1 FL=1